MASSCPEAGAKYDDVNLRRRKTVNGTATNFVWDGPNLLQEKDSGSITQAEYRNQPDEMWSPLAMKRSGVVSYYGLDLQDSVRSLITPSQTVSDTYDFTAFGNEIASSGSTVNPFGFIGGWGYYADAAGLVYVRNRVYDTIRGRWLSADPIGFNGGDWNLFRNVTNNPVNGVDPTGFAPINNGQRSDDSPQRARRFFGDSDQWSETPTSQVTKVERELRIKILVEKEKEAFRSGLAKLDPAIRPCAQDLAKSTIFGQNWFGADLMMASLPYCVKSSQKFGLAPAYLCAVSINEQRNQWPTPINEEALKNRATVQAGMQAQNSFEAGLGWGTYGGKPLPRNSPGSIGPLQQSTTSAISVLAHFRHFDRNAYSILKPLFREYNKSYSLSRRYRSRSSWERRKRQSVASLLLEREFSHNIAAARIYDHQRNYDLDHNVDHPDKSSELFWKEKWYARNEKKHPKPRQGELDYLKLLQLLRRLPSCCFLFRTNC